MNVIKCVGAAVAAVSLAGVISTSYAQTVVPPSAPATPAVQQPMPPTTPAEIMEPTMPNSSNAGNTKTPATNTGGAASTAKGNNLPNTSSSQPTGNTGMQTERVARADRN
jgi:hypothetical protein